MTTNSAPKAGFSRQANIPTKTINFNFFWNGHTGYDPIYGFSVDPITGYYYARAGYGPGFDSGAISVYPNAAALAANTPSSTVSLANGGFFGSYFTVNNGILFGRYEPPADFANGFPATSGIASWDAGTGASIATASPFPNMCGLNGTCTFGWGGFSAANWMQDSTGLYVLGVDSPGNWEADAMNPDLSVAQTQLVQAPAGSFGSGFFILGNLLTTDHYYSNVVTSIFNFQTGIATPVSFTLNLPGTTYYLSNAFYDPKIDRLYIWNTITQTLYSANKASQQFGFSPVFSAVPLINQPLVPTSVQPGTAQFTLTVNGSQFNSGSVVMWNGSPRATSYVNNSQLTATILSSDIVSAGTASITVVNPAPGGGTSNPVFFAVTAPASPITVKRTDINSFTCPSRFAVADFNGDGIQDMVVPMDCGNGELTILLGNGDGTFSSSLLSTPDYDASSLATGDFNGDGKIDIAVARTFSNTVTILLGNGDGTFQTPVSYLAGASPNSIVVADFNGDGKLDLAANIGGQGTVSILLGNGDGSFQAPVGYPVAPTGSGAFSLVTGDFNGDGNLDLVAVNNDSTISILLGDGDGTFQNYVEYAAGDGSNSVVAADFNHDGLLDLAVGDANSDSVSILLGNGDGTFQPPVPYAAGSSPEGVVAGDFDGDGKLDLAVANLNSDNVSILLGNGDGTFQTATNYATGQEPLMVVAADFNNDGRLDLAVPDFPDGTVTVLLQAPVANLSPASLSFGNQIVSTSSAPQIVTITNNGTAPLAISTLELGGADPGDFSIQTSTCGAIVVSGSTCSIGLTFTPTVTGARSAVLQIRDNAADFSQSVALGGTGTAFQTSTTGLLSSVNPSTFGQSATFTATVTPSAGGTPTGTVTFTDGSNVLGVVSLAGGQAALSTASLGAGSHSIVASYSGDSNYQPSASPTLTQTVHVATTTLGLASSVNPSGYNQAVTFTATVTPQVGGSATGTVTFFDGASPVGTATVTGNVATLTVSTLALGKHVIQASYAGDSNFAGSVSPTVAQVVKKVSTKTAVTSSVNPALVGQTITYTATVSGQFLGTVTGTVNFKASGVSLGSATLVNGQATIATSFSTFGTRSIAAVYSGDANNTGSTSPALSQVVNKGSSSTSIAANVNPSSFGEAVTFTATITTSGSPTGTVTFKSGAVSLGAATVTGNTASLTTSALAAGSHTITAVYSGDANFKGSTSSGESQVVSKARTAESLVSSPNPSASGQAVTFTATVSSSGGVPTGTVTFKRGSTTLGTAALSGGVATLTTSTLPAGSSKITANYGGTANYSPSTASVTQVVQ